MRTKAALGIAAVLVAGLLVSGEAGGVVLPGSNGLIVFDRPAAGVLALVDPTNGLITTIPNTVAADSNPSWAPNGQFITFDNGPSIFRIQPNGANRATITTCPGAGAAADEPQYDPTSSKIVFQCIGGTTPGIFEVPGNGGVFTNISGTVATDGDPDYSPDGQFIFFSSATGVSRVNSNGTGGRTAITGIVAGDNEPVISVNSQKIYFDDNGGAGVFEVPYPNGGARTQIFGSIAGDDHAGPSPDGQQIVVDNAGVVKRFNVAGGPQTTLVPADADEASWGPGAAPPTPPPGVTPTPTPTPASGTVSGTVFKVSRSGRTRGLRRATVSAGGGSSTTDRSGAYSIPNVLVGTNVSASARRKTCHADSVAGPLSRATTAANQVIDWFCVK